MQGNDSYQFRSGGILNSLFKYTEFDAYSHGQGPLDMQITPNGYGGNYFNAWNRTSHQEEGNLIYRFPGWQWLGKHQFETGGDLIYRTYSGTSQSRTILVTRQDGSLAEQLIYLCSAAGVCVFARQERENYRAGRGGHFQIARASAGQRFRQQSGASGHAV
ncbi:MAG: hypothetical protein P8Z30_20390 [Acidobacteriota bacterium]